MDLASELAEAMRAALWPSLFAFAFLTAVELLMPRGAVPIRARAAGLTFWAILLPVTITVFALFNALWRWIGVAPLVTIPLDFGWAGTALAWVLAPLAGAVVADFFFYWFHRAQHRWLWRWHAVHHSVRDLSAINAYHHVSEPLFHVALMSVPASLILADSGASAPAMTVILYLHASFIHSPTRLHLGPLAIAIVDNRFHRIHHSLEPAHFDRNFGAFTTIWDRLFGTAWVPARDEWPDTGLIQIDQPRNLREWFDLPLRLKRRPVDGEIAQVI